MTPLFTSWVCDYCDAKASSPDESVSRVSTGIPEMDRMLGGGYPIGAITEVFGDNTMFQLWFKPCVYLSLDWSLKKLAASVRELANARPTVRNAKKVTVCCSQNQPPNEMNYHWFAIWLDEYVAKRDYAIVLFNFHRPNDPTRSEGPAELGIRAALRIRCLARSATVVDWMDEPMGQPCVIPESYRSRP